MKIRDYKFIVCCFFIPLVFGCKSDKKIEISCVQTNDEIIIQNKSDESIYLSEVVTCNQQNDSLIIQPKMTRPGDWLYNRIDYYAFVPPKFKKIPSGKSLTLKFQNEKLTNSNTLFRIYDSDFHWKPSKEHPSHEDAYFKFEKEHSSFIEFRCK